MVNVGTKTFNLKREEIKRKWYVVDATDKILGRLATEIAKKLRGKDKPTFTPHVDCGDFVIVINAEKIKVKGGNKLEDKKYYRHTGYPGGISGHPDAGQRGVPPFVHNRPPIPLNLIPGVLAVQKRSDLGIRHHPVVQQQGVHRKFPGGSVAREPDRLDGICSIGIKLFHIAINRCPAVLDLSLHGQALHEIF